MLALLLAVNTLNFLDRQLPFILAESIRRDLGLSDTQLGLLGGLAFAACYSLAALPLGRLADRWSAKGVLVGSILAWSAMTASAGVARNFGQLAFARVGVAIGEAGCTPAAHAMIARTVPADRRGFALGLFAMGVPAGTMLGLILGGWISDHSSWRIALIAAGGTGVVLGAIAAVAIRQTDAAEDGPRDETPLISSAMVLFASPSFRWLFLAISLAGASIYATLSFSAPYLIRLHGFSTAQVGLWLGLAQGITGVAASAWGGRIFDRAMRQGGRHALRAPAIAFLVAAPSSAIAWFANGGAAAILFLVPVLFAFVLYIPATFGMAHRIAGPGRQGLATSILMIGLGLAGASVGPLVVGVVSDGLKPTLGPDALRWALLFASIVNALAGIAFVLAERRFRARGDVPDDDTTAPASRRRRDQPFTQRRPI